MHTSYMYTCRTAYSLYVHTICLYVRIHTNIHYYTYEYAHILMHTPLLYVYTDIKLCILIFIIYAYTPGTWNATDGFLLTDPVIHTAGNKQY